MMIQRLLACLLSISAGAYAATLTADYLFNGNLNDALSGGTALTSHGGTVGAGTYSFDHNEGLSVAGVLADGADYSVGMRFEFDQNAGWNKFLDFKNRSVDSGQYVNSVLNFYTGNSGGPVFAINTFHDVVLTRSGATGLYTAYLNGALAFSFTDNTGKAIFDQANRTMVFFMDDVATNTETSPGTVDRIMIWDGALTADEVAALDFLADPPPSQFPTSGVPEPGTFLLAGPVLVGLAYLRRRRA